MPKPHLSFMVDDQITSVNINIDDIRNKINQNKKPIKVVVYMNDE